MESLSVWVYYSLKQWYGFLFSGGKCLNEDGASGCDKGLGYYPEAERQKIWIDELLCFGFEDSIDECQKNNWGNHNCLHKEDAGCKCKKKDLPVEAVQFRKNNYVL